MVTFNSNMPITKDAENAIRCPGTLIIKGREERCNRIIAVVDHANDVKIDIQCQKCGTVTTIQARPKQPKNFVYNTPYQNRINGLMQK